MNVGDLVTLSARGKKLEACWRYSRDMDAPQLVGLIIAIEEPQFSYDRERKYIVNWINKGPAHRERYNYGRKTGHWHRLDLKFVAKAK